MALARIYRPAKTAMQSGRAKTRKWILEYEPASRRDPDPLMGWSSAHDTLNQVQLRFDTLDEALAYAKKDGLEYTVIEPRARTPKAKSYADNFRYDRVQTWPALSHPCRAAPTPPAPASPRVIAFERFLPPRITPRRIPGLQNSH